MLDGLALMQQARDTAQNALEETDRGLETKMSLLHVVVNTV